MTTQLYKASPLALLIALGAGTTCVACGSDEPLAVGGVSAIDDYALEHPVEILIDDHGAPHLYAQNDLDLFYAMGYQQASDRLFQMEVNRRSALGRLAELLGEQGLETDQQSRVFEFARFGGESVALLREERPLEHNFMLAFVSGVNRRIDDIQAGEAPRRRSSRSTADNPRWSTGPRPT